MKGLLSWCKFSLSSSHPKKLFGIFYWLKLKLLKWTFMKIISSTRKLQKNLFLEFNNLTFSLSPWLSSYLKDNPIKNLFLLEIPWKKKSRKFHNSIHLPSFSVNHERFSYGNEILLIFFTFPVRIVDKYLLTWINCQKIFVDEA